MDLSVTTGVLAHRYFVAMCDMPFMHALHVVQCSGATICLSRLLLAISLFALCLPDSLPALGEHRSWHHVDIIGSTGQSLGRLRVGLRVAKPMDKLMLLYKAAQKQEQHQQKQAVEASSSQVAATGACASLREVAAQQQQQQHDYPGSSEHDAALQVLRAAADQVRVWHIVLKAMRVVRRVLPLLGGVLTTSSHQETPTVLAVVAYSAQPLACLQGLW